VTTAVGNVVKAEYWELTLDAGGNVLAIDLYRDVNQECFQNRG
jgi:hypothetical protein